MKRDDPRAFLLEGTPVRVLASTRADGDVGPAEATTSPGAVGAARRALCDRPWWWVEQVHGAVVADAGSAGGPGGSAGEADAIVGAPIGSCFAVFGADCALVALGTPEGLAGVVHAGWRGLVAGVVEATVARLRAIGASDVVAYRGPCVHPECYPFGGSERRLIEDAFGAEVLATAADGFPAVDMRACVATALARSGARLVAEAPGCTACGGGHFSWRARRDTGRHALVVWRD